MTPTETPAPVPAPQTLSLRVDYARPRLRPRQLSDLRLAVVTIAVTVGAVTALAAGLFVLGSLAWGIGRLVGGSP